MRKNEFITQLSLELKKQVSQAEQERALFYYRELIDDAIDSGKDEVQFINSLPSPKEIARKLSSDIEGIDEQEIELNQESVASAFDVIFEQTTQTTQAPTAPQKPQKRSSGAMIVGKIALFLFIFLPIILPISVSLIATVFSVLVSFWAVVVSFVACAVAVPIYAVIVGVMSQSLPVFLTLIAAGLLCIGLSCLTIAFAKKVSVWLARAIKQIAVLTVKFFRI